MDTKQYTQEQEEIARFAKAMGHPARITILQFLASMDSCYFGDIHNELPIAKATVSQHLKELKDAALIREVHVYGTSLGIGKKDDERPQHSGLGSKLICEAEKISLDYGFKRISVISSIGTREYYQKLGYQLDNLYQSKDIK